MKFLFFIELLSPDSPQSAGGESAKFGSRLLRKFSEPLSQAIVAPDVLAEKLFMSQFISHSVYQAAISRTRTGIDRSRDLLEEVCEGILFKSVSFEAFLITLQQLPQVGTLPHVITSLQAEYGEINCNI